jgi:hypothetical protein
MAEEEDDGLADFRRNAGLDLRDELGRRFLAFKAEHAGTRGLDTSDVDPRRYVEQREMEAGQLNMDPSLRIGSLKEE